MDTPPTGMPTKEQVIKELVDNLETCSEFLAIWQDKDGRGKTSGNASIPFMVRTIAAFILREGLFEAVKAQIQLDLCLDGLRQAELQKPPVVRDIKERKGENYAFE